MGDGGQSVCPPNYFDVLRGALSDIDEAEGNDGMSKADAMKRVRSRLCFLLQKLLATPVSTGYTIFRIDEEG
jgi:hypothetical protein